MNRRFSARLWSALCRDTPAFTGEVRRLRSASLERERELRDFLTDAGAALDLLHADQRRVQRVRDWLATYPQVPDKLALGDPELLVVRTVQRLLDENP